MRAVTSKGARKKPVRNPTAREQHMVKNNNITGITLAINPTAREQYMVLCKVNIVDDTTSYTVSQPNLAHTTTK